MCVAECPKENAAGFSPAASDIVCKEGIKATEVQNTGQDQYIMLHLEG